VVEHAGPKQAKAAVAPWSADDVARLQAEQREMALLTFEAGMAAAREEAEQKGGTKVLLRQLTVKFGPQPPGVAARLASASQADVLRWSERVLSAETLEGVFA
jgi:hypothetical protein